MSPADLVLFSLGPIIIAPLEGSGVCLCAEGSTEIPRRRSLMFKKFLSLLLVALLINLAWARPALADSKEEKQARFVEKVKASVLKLGTGEAARVKVKLRDQTKLEGYVSAADGEGFTVMNPKTGTATPVAYPQVKSVKGNNLSTGAKIAIGAGIAAAVVLLILWKVIVDED